MKAITKLAHKVEAAGLDLGEGISRIGKNIGNTRRKSSDAAVPAALLPPEISRTPTFAKVLDDVFTRPSGLQPAGEDADFERGYAMVAAGGRCGLPGHLHQGCERPCRARQ